MEKYQRVAKNKQAEAKISENEIRITTQGKVRNYISYATNLFGGEKKQSDVVLKAMGRAINKTVTIAEILKRRIAGLHQTTAIDSTEITDTWEPMEEGLDRVETTRHISSITITLSINPLDTNAPGYQPPLSEDQVKPFVPRPRGRGRYRGRGFRGGRGFRARGGRGFRGDGRFRGRGGRFNDANSAEDVVEHEEQTDENQQVESYPRGRGRGFRSRGRGGRGRGRGRGGFRGTEGSRGGFRETEGPRGGFRETEGPRGGFRENRRTKRWFQRN